jgi:hypothetical protein
MVRDGCPATTASIAVLEGFLEGGERWPPWGVCAPFVLVRTVSKIGNGESGDDRAARRRIAGAHLLRKRKAVDYLRSIKPHPGGLHVEGFPEAAKVIRIEGPLARRLSDLSLHLGDLDFAGECLHAINGAPSDLIRHALWRSAVVHVLKCYGDGARFQLQRDAVL